MYKFLWTLVILVSIIIGLAWYFGWDKVRGWTINQSDSLGLQEFVSDPTKITANLKDKMAEYQTDTLEKFDELKESLGKEVAKQKIRLAGSISDGLNDVTGATAPVSVIMVAEIDQPHTFLIRNVSNEDADYEIDWGDGSRSQGLLISQEEELTNHIWDAIGDYLVTLGTDRVLVRVIK